MKALQRAIKRSEALAILPEALHSGPGAIWWDYFTNVPTNKRIGDIAIVSVRGSLDHYRGYGGTSYEGLIDNVSKALTGQDVVDEYTEKHRWEENVKLPEATPPKAVVLRIDSPGGVVSGLNECVFALRKASGSAGIPLVAYVDEMAASAAYALACACDEIVAPPSAIVGSIGVISTIYDQVDADEKAGIKFVTITSGERKADGHPHVRISEAALSAERKRVDNLAKQFFRIVADSRNLSIAEIASFQAGIFLAKDAKNKGLIDSIAGFDTFISDLASLTAEEKSVEPIHNRLAKSRANPSASSIHTESPRMLSTLAAMIRKTEASIKTEGNPKKKTALVAALESYKASAEAYKRTKHSIEKHETEEGEEEEEAEESEESSEEEAKGNETDRKEKKKAAAAESDDDEDSEDDGDEEDDDDDKAAAATHLTGGGSSARALIALATQATGKKGRAAVGALAAMIAQGQRAAAEVDAIRKERRAEKKSNLVASALAGRRITKHEAKELASKPLSFIEPFLAMRPKAIVNVDDDSIRIPAAGNGVASADQLPAAVSASIDQALMALPQGIDAKELRAAMVKAHLERMAASSNGRY